MDLGSLRALALDVNLAAHGVPITSITRPMPDNEPIVGVRGIWLPPLVEDPPVGRELQRREPRRVLVLRRADVPTVPRGTVIVAPEKAGDPDSTWEVDGTDRLEADRVHVIVRAVAAS